MHRAHENKNLLPPSEKPIVSSNTICGPHCTLPRCHEIGSLLSRFNIRPLLRYLSYSRCIDEPFATIVEFYRFMTLSSLFSSKVLVPGDTVQTVWSNFLLFPQLYTDFCHLLATPDTPIDQRLMNHDPLQQKTQEDWNTTLVCYESVFKSPAPATLWTLNTDPAVPQDVKPPIVKLEIVVQCSSLNKKCTFLIDMDRELHESLHHVCKHFGLDASTVHYKLGDTVLDIRQTPRYIALSHGTTISLINRVSQ